MLVYVKKGCSSSVGREGECKSSVSKVREDRPPPRQDETVCGMKVKQGFFWSASSV